uniref:NAC transcription factor 68 n=1 Tax=Litchi chinensis TaxID=151069 RepID=A0A8K1HZF2_LITCN|nr:NAC transcription factor 68 [Litchi chinensis]
MSLPAGYKFLPTEEELVIFYLENKVFCKPIPKDVIEEFEHDDIFGKPPRDVVTSFSEGLTVSSSSSKGSINECFFFLPQYEDFYCGSRDIFLVVGNGIGFWKSSGDEIALVNINGVIFALKLPLIYYSGRPSEARKTHWRMELYRLPTESYTKHSFKVKFPGKISLGWEGMG